MILTKVLQCSQLFFYRYPNRTLHFGVVFHFRVKIDDAGSLVIRYARKEDHGRYQCSAKNLAATRDSRPIRLKVHGKY